MKIRSDFQNFIVQNKTKKVRSKPKIFKDYTAFQEICFQTMEISLPRS